MRGLRGKSEVKNNKGKAPKNANIEEQAKEGALAKKTTKTQNKSQKGRIKGKGERFFCGYIFRFLWKDL